MKRAIVAAAVALAAAAAPAVAAADDEGEHVRDGDAFVDRAGALQPFRPAYAASFGPPPRVYFGRAAAEVGAMMAGGLFYYWIDPGANKEDWDNPSIEDRLTLRALTFDTNLNTTNHLLHPIAGGSVYWAARDNGLPIPAALGIGVLQSVVWELALEWREKTSINDILYTSLGGVALGEFVMQLGRYVNSAPYPGGSQRTAAVLLGPIRRFHVALDGETRPGVTLPPDQLGFSSAYGHAFRLGYDLAGIDNDLGREGLLHRLRLDGELVAMPGFLRPGAFSTVFSDGNFTELHIRLGVGDTGFAEADLQARATWLGHYDQSFEIDENGALHGLATMIGFGPGLRFQATDLLGRHDQLSALHLPGAHTELWLADGDVTARFGAEASVDFGSIQSLAYPGLLERRGRGPEGTKTVLQRQGYAYSLGLWTRARAAMGWGPLSFDGSIGYGRYESIDTRDRFQARVDHDAHGVESVLEVAAGASVRLAGPLVLGAGFAERRRVSRLAEVWERRWDRELRLSAALVF